MAFSMARLLLVDDHVPPRVRAALRDAFAAPPHDRRRRLEVAARVLYDETELDCGDVRELVGLAADEADEPFDCGRGHPPRVRVPHPPLGAS